MAEIRKQKVLLAKLQLNPPTGRTVQYNRDHRGTEPAGWCMQDYFETMIINIRLSHRREICEQWIWGKLQETGEENHYLQQWDDFFFLNKHKCSRSCSRWSNSLAVHHSFNPYRAPITFWFLGNLWSCISSEEACSSYRGSKPSQELIVLLFTLCTNGSHSEKDLLNEIASY